MNIISILGVIAIAVGILMLIPAIGLGGPGGLLIGVGIILVIIGLFVGPRTGRF